jgi:hypothetical protein
MKLLLFTLSLCLATLISGCQSWSTVILAVDGADVPAIRSAIATSVATDGFRPCADWHARVVGSDLCVGKQVEGKSITVAGFQTAQGYIVKIGIYATGRLDSGTVDRVEARCREAMSAASPNAQVTRTTSRGLLPVERI